MNIIISTKEKSTASNWYTIKYLQHQLRNSLNKILFKIYNFRWYRQ